MLGAIVLVGLVVVAMIGGKAALVILCGVPLLGSIATWYMNYVGELADGRLANLIYGLMAMQLVLMTLAPILYGQSVVHRAVDWLHARRVGANRWAERANH